MYTTFFATLITSSVLAPYLLSVSRLVLLSSMTNTLLTGTSMSSCPEDVTNASIPLSQGMNVLVQRQTSSVPTIPGYVPGQHLLAALEEEENKTEAGNIVETLGDNWRQQVSNVLLQHHRRGSETASANSGISLKCESSYCHDYSQAEAIKKVQQVLENLLHSKSNKMPNYMKPPKRHLNGGGLHCSTNRLCPVY